MKKILLYATILTLTCITQSCNSPEMGEPIDTRIVLIHFDDADSKNYVVALFEHIWTGNDSLYILQIQKVWGRPCIEDSLSRVPYIELDNGYLLVKRQWSRQFAYIVDHLQKEDLFLLTNQHWEELETSPDSVAISDSASYAPAHMEGYLFYPEAIEGTLYGKRLIDQDYTWGSDYMKRYHFDFICCCDEDSARLAERDRQDALLNEWAEMINQIIQKGLFEKMLSYKNIPVKDL